MRYFILALFMFVITIPAYADTPLTKGENIPSIALQDQNGEARIWDDLIGKRGAVIVFYRSAEWCPYCQAQLIELGRNKDKFDRSGYHLIGISYDSVEKLKKFDNKYNLDFPFLSDPESETIKQFGILDESHKEGSFAYGVPQPTIYVVSKTGIVQDILAEEGYKNRPQVDVIIDSIESVNQ